MLEDRDDEMQRVLEDSVEPKTLDAETLRTPVSALVQRKPVCVLDDSPISQSIRMMQDEHIGAVLVVDRLNKLVGIFTERDLIQRVAGKRLDWDTTLVGKVMSPNPETLKPGDMVAFALNYMHMGGYRHVPIVDDENEPVGVVSVKDFVAYLTDYFPQEVYNLPPEPMREGPDQRYGG